jgi:hypothetical protein
VSFLVKNLAMRYSYCVCMNLPHTESSSFQRSAFSKNLPLAES